MSIEGTVIVEREDANVQAYGAQVSAKRLLGGSVDPPQWASVLINTLEVISVTSMTIVSLMPFSRVQDCPGIGHG